MLACFILFRFSGGGGRSRTEKPTSSVLQSGRKSSVQAAGLGSSHICPSCPELPISPPHLPTELAWLSARLRAGPALSPDACYLHTHLWTNGRPGWLLVTPAWRGPSSQACVWQFGLEPKVGGLTMEEAQPSSTPGAFNSRMTCMDIPFTGQESGPGNSSRPPVPSLTWFYSKPYNVGRG